MCALLRRKTMGKTMGKTRLSTRLSTIIEERRRLLSVMPVIDIYSLQNSTDQTLRLLQKSQCLRSLLTFTTMISDHTAGSITLLEEFTSPLGTCPYVYAKSCVMYTYLVLFHLVSRFMISSFHSRRSWQLCRRVSFGISRASRIGWS